MILLAKPAIYRLSRLVDVSCVFCFFLLLLMKVEEGVTRRYNLFLGETIGTPNP